MTTNHTTEKITTTSADINEERIAQLRQLFPEAFTEDKVDFDKLRATLGDLVDDRPERYSFTWAGKQDAIRILQTPTNATLIPAPDESVDFNNTQNIFIEGDNLEALKLLYKSYFGRVKMIYIDPPYNTGNDFIYPDNYADPLETYFQITGQKDAEGNLLTTNSDISGRYHSAWLTMMYPRLFIARQLLSEDGVIFISIDDNEIHNLRLLMNEVFGEENFVAQLIWEKGRKNDAKLFSVGHEYIVVFARSREALREQKISWREEKPGAQDILAEYQRLRQVYDNDNQMIEKALKEYYSSLTKNHPAKKHARYNKVDNRGVWRDDNLSWPGGGGPTYDVIHPRTGKPCALPEGGWRYSTPEKMQEMIEKGDVVFRNDHTEPPIRKTYLVRSGAGQIENNDNVISGQVMGTYFYKSGLPASRNLLDLFGSKVFDNPKDDEILGRLIKYVTGSDDIILDFFAGSATIAQAILQLNKQQRSARKFVLVQIPEPTPEKSRARKAGFKTITGIAKERIRRVIQQMRAEDEGKLLLQAHETPEDLGFKVFKLAPTNFRSWEGTAEATPEEFASQMELFTDPLVEGWRAPNVIYEIALKEGYSLNCYIQRTAVSGHEVYRVNDQEKDQHFYLCLENQITANIPAELELEFEDLFVCRDIALDDTMAANLALQCRLKTI